MTTNTSKIRWVRWATRLAIVLMLQSTILALLAPAQEAIMAVRQRASVVAAAIGPLDFHMGGAGWTNGATLTTTLLNSGTLGNGNHAGWAVNGTGITTGAPITGCGTSGSIQVNGDFTALGYSQHSIVIDNTGNSRNATVTIPNSTPAGYTIVAQEFCFNVGAANDGAGSSLFDKNRVIGISGGDQYVLQMQNGTAGTCGQFCIEIEYVNSGGTQHSAGIPIVSTGTYKASFYVNVSSATVDTGLATVKLFDTSNVQVGSTINVTNGPTGQLLQSACLGSCAAHGTSTGSDSFQNWSVRFSGKPQPLDPVNTAQDPVYWVATCVGNNHSSTGTTTLATATACSEHVGDSAIVNCINENATGNPSSITNTALETFTLPVSLKNTGTNSQSIQQGYTFVSVDHATQTYTCNGPSSAFSNIIAIIMHGATAFDTGNTGNTNTTNVISGTYTPTSATATSVACAYHQAVGAIGADANNFLITMDATNSRGCQLRTNTPTSSQSTTGIFPTSSQGIIAVGVYK